MILIVLVLWPAAAEAAGAYTNAQALAVILVGGGTATAYRNHRNRS
ncbi:hypothetical protein [Streptomyces sp. NPDC001594]